MLNRFIDAQEKYYATAWREIKKGKKESHWMWFVFPQINGLGYSEISKYFSIKSLGEAREYLAHPVLGKRLREITDALLDLKAKDPEDIFGPVDAKKLHSCMTLFYMISGEDVFADVLIAYFNAELDWNTVKIVRLMENGKRD